MTKRRTPDTADNLERLCDEVRCLRESMDEVYLVLDHFVRNFRDHIGEVVNLKSYGCQEQGSTKEQKATKLESISVEPKRKPKTTLFEE